MSDLAPITHPLLTAAGIAQGFFTRAGGVSTGLYEGLNAGVGSKDDPAAVAETAGVSRAISTPTRTI